MLLSDFNREFGTSYGLTFDAPNGNRNLLRRTVFIIAQDGTIAYRWDVPDPPGLPKADEVIEALRALG